MYSDLYVFGCSHMVGEELSSYGVPAIREKVVEFVGCEPTIYGNIDIRDIKITFRDLILAIKEITNEYYGGFEQSKLVDNELSLGSNICKLLNIPTFVNKSVSGASNEYIIHMVLENYDDIVKCENPLVVISMTSFGRRTKFTSGYVENTSWEPHNQANHTVMNSIDHDLLLAYTELRDRYGPDTLTELYQAIILIKGLKNIFPENIEVVIVSAMGNLVQINDLTLWANSAPIDYQENTKAKIAQMILDEDIVFYPPDILPDSRCFLGHFAPHIHASVANEIVKRITNK